MNIKIISKKLNQDLCLSIANIYLLANEFINHDEEAVSIWIDMDNKNSIDHLFLDQSSDITFIIGQFSINEKKYFKEKSKTSSLVLLQIDQYTIVINRSLIVELDFFNLEKLDESIFTIKDKGAYFLLYASILEQYYSKKVAQKCILSCIGNNAFNMYSSTSINKALHYIHKNYHKDIKIKDIANFLNISERTLLRRFKQELGMCPNKYIQMTRINQAKKLLYQTDSSFEKITMNVGYYNPSSFRNLFKTEVGLTPIEYRAFKKGI